VSAKQNRLPIPKGKLLSGFSLFLLGVFMVVAEKTRCSIKAWVRVHSAWLRRYPSFPASGDEGHVRWEICLHILFCPKFRRKFQEKYG
jgi:hypothetical protein